ncbi:MAG: DUF2339 domain-containing protein, partial [Candidatus Pacebacteria bacterium]|nr:DUF2339 domain-containing protein [Candidatus Paceibacterota bacterium]
MEFIIILIISGYFVVKIGNLNSRIDKLESREQITPSENTSDTATVMPRMPIKSIPVVQSSVDVGLVNNPEVENSFVHWLKQDFLMKAGALLLMLAFSWFVSFAFANNWIGPMGRIALGVLLGVAFMMVGVWRIKKYAHQGGIFTVLGASGVLLTIFAARELYDFFTPVSALAFMFLTIVFVTFVSLRYKMQSLALAALVMGAAAPLMIGSYASDATSLFSYLLVIVLGVLWVVSRTGWANLTFVALLISFLYSFPYMVFGVGSSEQDVVLLFAFVFTALFFIYNIFSITHRRENSLSKAHAVTALGTGIYIMSWISISVDDEWKSLLYVAWALVFAVGSYIAHTLSSNRTVFYLYGVTSVALIAAATAAEMSGPVLTIAYTFEVALMLVVAA